MDDFVGLGSLRLVIILLLLDPLSILLGLLSSKLLCLFGFLGSGTPSSNSISAIIGVVDEGTTTIALLAGASVAITPLLARNFGDFVLLHCEGCTGVENLQVSVGESKEIDGGHALKRYVEERCVWCLWLGIPVKEYYSEAENSVD